MGDTVVAVFSNLVQGNGGMATANASTRGVTAGAVSAKPTADARSLTVVANATTSAGAATGGSEVTSEGS